MDKINIKRVAWSALVGGLMIGIIILIFLKPKAENLQPVIPEIKIEQVNYTNIGEYKYTPNHEQVVWRFVLEWCESRGNNEAINGKDSDGTPSFSNYQFKPKTLKYYASKYKLLPDNLKIKDYLIYTFDYDLTTEILNRMLNDKDIKWESEFPMCVKKFGLPPKV